MGRRVRDVGSRARRVLDSSSRAERVNEAQVARALGAERIGSTDHRPGLSLASIHRELSQRLRSTGGRPSLEGATRRQKIPISDADWKELERLAEHLGATPGQVASVLLHQLLEELDPAAVAALMRRKV